jgi:hypothetical protein
MPESLSKVTGNPNVTAASAGVTHIVDAELDAVVAALSIFDPSEDGNAPIVFDGRILEGLARPANRIHGLPVRAEVIVHGLKVVAKRTANEVVFDANVVPVATHIVKHFEYLASKLGDILGDIKVAVKVVVKVVVKFIVKFIVKVVVVNSVSGKGHRKEL